MLLPSKFTDRIRELEDDEHMEVATLREQASVTRLERETAIE